MPIKYFCFIFCHRGLTNAYKMLVLCQTFHRVRFSETVDSTLILEGRMSKLVSNGLMSQPQQLVLTSGMILISSMGFISKLFCWLRNTVLLHAMYIHYFGVFRYFTSIARVLLFHSGIPFVVLDMWWIDFSTTFFLIFTFSYLRTESTYQWCSHLFVHVLI